MVRQPSVRSVDGRHRGRDHAARARRLAGVAFGGRAARAADVARRAHARRDARSRARARHRSAPHRRPRRRASCATCAPGSPRRSRASACARRSRARIRWCAPRTSRSRPGARYQYLHSSLRELARREPTFALHVHVSVPDPELAVRAFNGIRAHIPVLLALAANSPFMRGLDTGLASARTPVFQAFPRTGIPRALRDLRRVRRGDRRADPLRRDPRADVHLVGRAPAAASSGRSRSG